MPNALPRPAFPDEHRLQFSDVLSKTHGAHTLKFGVDMNFVHEVLINLFQGGGVYTYSGSNNFSNWVADVAGINFIGTDYSGGLVVSIANDGITVNGAPSMMKAAPTTDGSPP